MRTLRGKLGGCRSVLEHNISTRQILTRTVDYRWSRGVRWDDGCIGIGRGKDSANRCCKRLQKALFHKNAPCRFPT